MAFAGRFTAGMVAGWLAVQWGHLLVKELSGFFATRDHD
jgi:hypothetical protein